MQFGSYVEMRWWDAVETVARVDVLDATILYYATLYYTIT